MVSEPLVLGFDTSAAHCAAALLCGDRVLAARAEAMGRGQAERLMPLIAEMLARNGAGWRDLDRIGVGVGPGNFTGIRISVAAARGLSLSLGIPAVGVSQFAVIGAGQDHPHLAAVPAPREHLYIAPRGQAPSLVSRDEAEALGLPVELPPVPKDLAVAVAWIAGHETGPFAAPAPLYVKPADAAPSREAPLVILDDGG